MSIGQLYGIGKKKFIPNDITDCIKTIKVTACITGACNRLPVNRPLLPILDNNHDVVILFVMVISYKERRVAISIGQHYGKQVFIAIAAAWKASLPRQRKLSGIKGGREITTTKEAIGHRGPNAIPNDIIEH
jgi:hypothetical protein